MQAEAIRDSILAVSGSLDRSLGGATVKPGTKTEYGYKFEGTRRSIYTPVFRNTLPQIMEVFDFADPNLVTGKRTTSSVATQALFLMNNPFVQHQAIAASARLLADKASTDATKKVDYAYLLALGRNPTVREKQIILDFVKKAEDADTAWAKVFQSLFSSLDFRYLN